MYNSKKIHKAILGLIILIMCILIIFYKPSKKIPRDITFYKTSGDIYIPQNQEYLLVLRFKINSNEFLKSQKKIENYNINKISFSSDISITNYALTVADYKNKIIDLALYINVTTEVPIFINEIIINDITYYIGEIYITPYNNKDFQINYNTALGETPSQYCTEIKNISDDNITIIDIGFNNISSDAIYSYELYNNDVCSNKSMECKYGDSVTINIRIDSKRFNNFDRVLLSPIIHYTISENEYVYMLPYCIYSNN